MKKLLTIFGVVALVSCEQPTYSWQLSDTTTIEGVRPIGIVADNDRFIISDGDHNRMVAVDKKGQIKELMEIERPMHLDSDGKGKVLIPSYVDDAIIQWDGDQSTQLTIDFDIDAPAGVAMYNKERAIADFYGNKVHYFDGTSWMHIGGKGKHEAEFSYPTDVQITKDFIYVADAYNHRVQVFDKSGKFVQMIGEDQNMNASTGLYVDDTSIVVTDFENNRVLLFNLNGELKQILTEGIDKPTELLLVDNSLYITNYRKGELVTYELKQDESI